MTALGGQPVIVATTAESGSAGSATAWIRLSPAARHHDAHVANDGKVTAPGRYLVMCSIPIGADPAAYLAAAKASKGGPVSVPGGAPHHSAGMVTELTAS